MSHRLVALVLAGLFLASAASTAWAHCAGWSAAVADAHACCRGGAMATEARAVACCGMSEQAEDSGPVEARVAAGPVKVARPVAPPLALPLSVSAVPAHAPLFNHTRSSVPLYLRQVSLLI